MACGKTIIIPENFLVYGLIEKYSGILVSENVIRAEGIRLAMELENIEDPQEATQTGAAGVKGLIRIPSPIQLLQNILMIISIQ